MVHMYNAINGIQMEIRATGRRTRHIASLWAADGLGYAYP